MLACPRFYWYFGNFGFPKHHERQPFAAAVTAQSHVASSRLAGVGNMASQALRLLSNLLLTRLLLPEAFGLVAAVNTLYFALVMFSDLGVWQSVVKSERGTQVEFLGTAWSVQLLRGALLCLVVLAIALGLFLGAGEGYFQSGTVYADPRLTPMMAVFSLCALLQGLESMKLATAQRTLKVAYLARLEIISQIVAMQVTLGLALTTKSVWSLLVGTLVSAGTRTFLSHWYLPGPNCRPAWDKLCAAEIIGFGKWIFVSSVIGFLAAHGEKLILGGSLSTSSFGVFSIATTLLMAVMSVYGSLNAHLIFATLSGKCSVRSGKQIPQPPCATIFKRWGARWKACHWRKPCCTGSSQGIAKSRFKRRK